jgi:hypothetical protein
MCRIIQAGNGKKVMEEMEIPKMRNMNETMKGDFAENSDGQGR